MTEGLSGNISRLGEKVMGDGRIRSGRARRGDFTVKQSFVQGLRNLQERGDVDPIPALGQPGI